MTRVKKQKDSPPEGTRSSLRADRVRAALASNYSEYQYRFVEFFVEHLCDLSLAFRGDLQQMIVLAVVGQVRLYANNAARAAGEDVLSIDDSRLTITASRIADVTGIPRETVRRKLLALERKGWISRDASSGWSLVVAAEVPARVALSDLDARAIGRVARLFAGLEAIVNRGGA
jgi:hypothetical protein